MMNERGRVQQRGVCPTGPWDAIRWRGARTRAGRQRRANRGIEPASKRPRGVAKGGALRGDKIDDRARVREPNDRDEQRGSDRPRRLATIRDEAGLSGSRMTHAQETQPQRDSARPTRKPRTRTEVARQIAFPGQQVVGLLTIGELDRNRLQAGLVPGSGWVGDHPRDEQIASRRPRATILARRPRPEAPGVHRPRAGDAERQEQAQSW